MSVYTDGSWTEGRSTIGVAVFHAGYVQLSGVHVVAKNNNEAELLAAMNGIYQAFHSYREVHLHTDSTYVINRIQKALDRVHQMSDIHLNELEQLVTYIVLRGGRLQVSHVRAHRTDYNNLLVDVAARVADSGDFQLTLNYSELRDWVRAHQTEFLRSTRSASIRRAVSQW